MKYVWMIPLFLLGCVSGPKTDTAAISQPQLRPFQVKTLENGLTIYYVSDASLPRVSLQALVKVGAVQDPTGREGLNDLVANLLDQGTKNRNAERIAEDFNSLGTEFGGNAGSDLSIFSASTLSTESNRLLDLFADVLINPSFPAQEVQRQKDQSLSLIRRMRDNPSAVAQVEYEKYIFAGLPYGRDNIGTLESVRRISRADILKHYRAWYEPGNTIVAVSGRFDDAFRARVEKSFAAWKRSSPSANLAGGEKETGAAGMLLVSKPNLVQAQIRVGQLSIERLNPDHTALRLAGEVLGGGFGARLMQRIRDDLGLTYGAYSRLDSRKQAGAFTVNTFTRNETVRQTIQEVLGLYERFVRDGVTESELRTAKAQILGHFPRLIETPEGYAQQLLLIDFYGLPKNYLTDYHATINGVTTAQVNAAIRKHLSKDKLKILVYGSETLLDQLKEWNPQIKKAE